MAGFEFVHPGQSFSSTQHDRRGNPFHDIPDEPARYTSLIEGVKCGLDRTATVMTEYRDQRNVKDGHRVFDRAEHR